MSYLAIKYCHIACALLSGGFFVLRGCWMIAGSALLRRRWVRTAPHALDTLLLSSALTMAIWSGQYPFVDGWLTAKIVALLLYIVLGSIALKRGKTRASRLAAFAGALAVFSYIVSVALTKQPLPLI
jgi:uncharacterized membrane protein SirB2